MNRKSLALIIVVLVVLVFVGIWHFGIFKNTSTTTPPQGSSPSSTASATSSTTTPVVTCASSSNYFVISNNLIDSVGSDILVKYKTSADQQIPCAYNVASGDFEIDGAADAAYFMGLASHFLLLDSGTAPDPRGLTIYDLNSRKQVFADVYSEPITIATDAVSYWTPVNTKVTAANCPELSEFSSEGLGAEIESYVILNLFNLMKTTSTQDRCSPVQ